MYVKIITDNPVWRDGISEYKKGDIYPVVYDEKRNVFRIKGTYEFVQKKDCEIIDFNPDQISEEMADKLAEEITYVERSGIFSMLQSEEETKLKWKQKGYIKQNRADEIKKELESNNILSYEIIELQKELIEIYENKIKELENETK